MTDNWIKAEMTAAEKVVGDGNNTGCHARVYVAGIHDQDEYFP
jgi:hypothetical protein